MKDSEGRTDRRGAAREARARSTPDGAAAAVGRGAGERGDQQIGSVEEALAILAKHKKEKKERKEKKAKKSKKSKDKKERKEKKEKKGKRSRRDLSDSSSDSES